MPIFSKKISRKTNKANPRIIKRLIRAGAPFDFERFSWRKSSGRMWIVVSPSKAPTEKAIRVRMTPLRDFWENCLERRINKRIPDMRKPRMETAKLAAMPKIQACWVVRVSEREGESVSDCDIVN